MQPQKFYCPHHECEEEVKVYTWKLERTEFSGWRVILLALCRKHTTVELTFESIYARALNLNLLPQAETVQ